MSNQSRYFSFIFVVFCLITTGFGLFIFLPGISALNKPTGQVLGIKEAIAPDIDKVGPISKINFEENKTLEIQKDITSNSKLLIKLPSVINGFPVQRDDEKFYINCKDEINTIVPEIGSGLQDLGNSQIDNLNIKNFVSINQINTDEDCRLSEFDIAKILDTIEIRTNNNKFEVDQATSFLKRDGVSYILSGNCILNGITKEQLRKYTNNCSLWSLPSNQIYPELISDKLRQWFTEGDISFYEESKSTSSVKTPDSSLTSPYQLVNINAVKQEANIFFVRDGNLKLSDFREVKDVSKFSKENTIKTISLPFKAINNYFYRSNTLPVFELDKSFQDKTMPSQNISCFWSNEQQTEYWYKESMPSIPLIRNVNCPIGQMIADQNIKSSRLSKDELTTGDAWVLDNSALEFSEQIFDNLKKLGYQDMKNTEFCKLTNNNEMYFKRQLCPFGVLSVNDLQSLSNDLSTTTKAGQWHIKEETIENFTYQIYVQIKDKNLWVYWYKLNNDDNLNVKKIELNTIMQKVSIK